MTGLLLQVHRMRLRSQDWTVEIRPWLGRPWTLKAQRRSHRCSLSRQSRQVNRGQIPGNPMNSLSKSRQLQLQIIMQRLRSWSRGRPKGMQQINLYKSETLRWSNLKMWPQSLHQQRLSSTTSQCASWKNHQHRPSSILIQTMRSTICHSWVARAAKQGRNHLIWWMPTSRWVQPLISRLIRTPERKTLWLSQLNTTQIVNLSQGPQSSLNRAKCTSHNKANRA